MVKTSQQHQEQERLKQLQKQKQRLEAKEIVITLKKGNEPSKGLTLAQQLYILENGSPINNLPPRPVVQIGLHEGRKAIKAHMEKGVALGMAGRALESDRFFHLAGAAAVYHVQRAFGEIGKVTPLTEKTFKGKQTLINAPLIDTGALKEAITYNIGTREDKR